MIYPATPNHFAKICHRFKEWCTEDKRHCNPQTVPDEGITLSPVFVVDGGLIVGTMIGFVLSYSLIFLVVALLFLFKNEG